MLLLLRAEFQLVHVVDDFPKVIPALNLVTDFPEDFADLVFDRIGSRGSLLETV